MKQIDIPLVLSFRYSRIQEFVMYTGSHKGVATCGTAGVKPSDLWTDKIKKKGNLYKEMGLVFIDDTRLKIIPHNYYTTTKHVGAPLIMPVCSPLSQLKDKESKITWCNIHYTFQ
jgi:hypothetical protein